MKPQTLNLINLKLPLKASIPKDDLEMRTEVAVIGAGPSGLLAARELAERGVDVKVFVAGILSSGPAPTGKYRLDSLTSLESMLFVMASIVAPLSFAS